MLYYLFRFLEQFGISGSGMWSYISFRALLALILSLIISAWFGEKFIKYLKSKQITETQRDAKIDPFGVKKIGVPSMGGVIIIVSILIPVLLLGRLRNIYLILMIITTVWLRLPRRSRRLHQDFPPQQGRPERQVQDRGTGFYRPHRRSRAVGFTRCEDEREPHDPASERPRGGGQAPGRGS